MVASEIPPDACPVKEGLSRAASGAELAMGRATAPSVAIHGARSGHQHLCAAP